MVSGRRMFCLKSAVVIKGRPQIRPTRTEGERGLKNYVMTNRWKQSGILNSGRRK